MLLPLVPLERFPPKITGLNRIGLARKVYV
jgi:hypothetical protein